MDSRTETAPNVPGPLPLKLYTANMIQPTPLASLAPLSRTETATALSATAASDSLALETTTAEPRVTSGMVEPTNSRTLRKQSSHLLAVASGSGDSGEPGKRKGKEKEVVPSHPEPSSSSSMLAIPGEKEAFDFFHLTPPPATETMMKAKDRNNDNIARLAVAIHHLQLQGNTEHIGVQDDITTLAAVQASFREALDTHQGASSAGPSLPSSLVAFPEWHDIHAAVSSLQDCASSQSAEVSCLRTDAHDSLRIPNVQKQILDLQWYLETEVAEMRGRLSSQALSQPTLQPFPSLGAGDAPLASGSRFISPMMTPSTYVSPYGGATVKHSLPETFPQAAKRFHQEDEGTELLVEGVRNEETTAAVARRILSTTDTAFVKVLAAYRLRDRSASPHVVLRFKTSDSASRFLRIVTDACPLELHGLQFRLIPRPAADNTVSYETLQTRWNPLPPRSDIRAPELQGQLRAEYPSTGCISTVTLDHPVTTAHACIFPSFPPSPPVTITHASLFPSSLSSLPVTTAHAPLFPSCPSSPGENCLCISVLVWNIHGSLILKLRDNVFTQYIQNFEIAFLLETWLRPGQDNSLPLPSGYRIVSSPRPDRPGLRRAGPGVAVIFKEQLDIVVKTEHCMPDIVVLETPDFMLVGAYLLPSGSSYGDWSECDPVDRLEDIITIYAKGVKPTYVLGDLNCRTADLVRAEDSPPRISLDKVSNSRGKWMLDLCRDNVLELLNGTCYENNTPGQLTSFQPMGSAVVDYVLASKSALPLLQCGALTVVKSPQSDHAAIELTLPYQPGEQLDVLPTLDSDDLCSPELPPTELDNVVSDVLLLAQNTTEAIDSLYGPVFADTGICAVSLAAASHLHVSSERQAAFAVYWGENSIWNNVAIIPQMPPPTTNRAIICALISALQMAEQCPQRHLDIYTSSEFLIRSFCYWAAEHEQHAYDCAHSDLIKVAVSFLRNRAAPVQFRMISRKSNAHSMVTQNWASQVAKSCRAYVWLVPPPYPEPASVTGNRKLHRRKVFSELEEYCPTKTTPFIQVSDPDREELDPDHMHSHRGRNVTNAV
ncbi:hypothetical protein BDP27DRAFT_1429190 [Rhodocollybia butyracea]|uniref:Endonuclease/exonuclease/phosphatase domain-containing protein n=1 Tax=Rhodocollybia butyracea TaxID=206335 RepID=A0A9P5PFL3_9AGAR|nr:hypothetical protein BDP27DRAFT_1429190 [Rhodocollybia butyracea]